MTLGGGQAGGAGGPGWGPENSLSGDQALPGAPTAAALCAPGAEPAAPVALLRVRLATAAPGHQGWGGLCAQTLRLGPVRSSCSLDCCSSG